MPTIDHNDADLTIYKMVRNRLAFVADTNANQELISNFTLELMFELEPCFQIDPDGVGGLIGIEGNYSVPQKAVVADLVCCYILVKDAGVVNASTEAGIGGTFLKKVAAGSVNVEYDQVDERKGGSTMSTRMLYDMYKKSAIRKARVLGCVIDICDDCSLAVEKYDTAMPHPFIVVTSCVS